MMDAVGKGSNKQTLHEAIRVHSITVDKRICCARLSKFFFVCKTTTGKVIWGIEEGKMLYIRDEITLKNTAWAMEPVSAIVCCWLKSKIKTAIVWAFAANAIPILGSPLDDLLNDTNAYDSLSSMHLNVHNPAPDEGRLQHGLADSEIQGLFDTQDGNEEHSSTDEVEYQSVAAVRAM
eukprot:IDg13194t1